MAITFVSSEYGLSAKGGIRVHPLMTKNYEVSLKIYREFHLEYLVFHSCNLCNPWLYYSG